VFDNVFHWIAGHAVTRPGAALSVAVVAFVAVRLAGAVIRRSIRHVALRSLRAGPGAQPGLWRARTRRVGTEPSELGEQRRRQRIDAASRMVTHLVSVAIWLIAAIVMFHVLDVDPAFFISSAGFLGAGLAIGGQHKVHDYLTGLSVHFEDRYGVGDEIIADVGWAAPVQGVVDHIGLFSTRVRDRHSTLHFPNGALTNVRNLSQEAATVEFKLRVPDDTDTEDVAATLRRLAGSNGLTDVVFVGDLEAHEAATGEVAVRAATSSALDSRDHDELVHRAERALGSS
jgi:small-conductance mechanosensitive channel